jgi:hypothetical protein
MNIKKQDKIIKIDSYLRTNKTSFVWNLKESPDDSYYEVILPTDIGTITLHINVEDTPYTLITCFSDQIWKNNLLSMYYQKANEWMLSSDILRVIVDPNTQRIVYSYTYTAQEDYFDPSSLISIADSLIQKVLELCLPELFEVDSKEKSILN